MKLSRETSAYFPGFRIKKIECLDSLTKLDVLDLHGNNISRVESLDHLAELRVLNLAGNLITQVDSLSGMDALTELNLRRNRITTVVRVDQRAGANLRFYSGDKKKNFLKFDLGKGS